MARPREGCGDRYSRNLARRQTRAAARPRNACLHLPPRQYAVHSITHLPIHTRRKRASKDLVDIHDCSSVVSSSLQRRGWVTVTAEPYAVSSEQGKEVAALYYYCLLARWSPLLCVNSEVELTRTLVRRSACLRLCSLCVGLSVRMQGPRPKVTEVRVFCFGRDVSFWAEILELCWKE